MKFGDLIETPNGKGHFAGRLTLEEVVYVLVRHNMAMLPERPVGLFITPAAKMTALYAYTNEQIVLKTRTK